MIIEVVEYDPRWADQGEAACAELRALFPAVEHIGSTAVPGLAAKPIIDLMAPVAELSDAQARDAELHALGYEPTPPWAQHRLFYPRSRNGVVTHHLHIVLADSWATRNQRLLRDYLRAHPEAVARYAAIKRQLAAGTTDRADYTWAKTELIQELVDAARAERGLPSAPVWEQ